MSVIPTNDRDPPVQGATQLSLQRHQRLRILLTGGTGFLGQGAQTQLATQYGVDEVAVVIRPKAIRDRKTGEILNILSPAEQSSKLLDDLGITNANTRDRFRFIAGDIEQPMFGIDEHGPRKKPPTSSTVRRAFHSMQPTRTHSGPMF